MKLRTLIAVGAILFTGALYAQTPDGQTPADEAVCDPLMVDGVTKGLYGLCVAFCEAGDYADESDTISPEELATLETSTPSGRILANYNKKKDKANNPADPDMPCILVDESCPCWTAYELAEIDGIMYDGYDTPNLICHTYSDSGFIFEIRDVSPWDYMYAGVTWYDGYESCKLLIDVAPYNLTRHLSIKAGTLTWDQYNSCVSSLSAHKAQYIGTKSCDD